MGVKSIHMEVCPAWERYPSTAQTLAEIMRKQMGSKHPRC